MAKAAFCIYFMAYSILIYYLLFVKIVKTVRYKKNKALGCTDFIKGHGQ